MPSAMPEDLLGGIEALEDVGFDERLVDRLLVAGARYRSRPLDLATPTFKRYESEELEPCRGNRFPAFSLTGPACALNCTHCQAKVLAPMIPAITPALLVEKVRAMVAQDGITGLLLSGGSNRRNELPYPRFLPAIRAIKAEFPHLRLLAHTALAPAAQVRALGEAGVEVGMMDVIGDAGSIREIYRLDRPVADFEQALADLCASGLRAVPHIVLGLHNGCLRGEWRALEIVARQPVAALVLVVVMPSFAVPGRFVAPAPATIGSFFLQARATLPDRPVILGCARPTGLHRREVDAYAVLAGLDGVAHPAPGAVTLARALGRPVRHEHACCALGRGC